MKNFYIKDDNGKLWVEVTIVTFLDAVAIVDQSSHRQAKMTENISKFELYILQDLNCRFVFERISKLDGDYSYWQILSLVSPWNTTWRGFNAINHKERGKMADILNEVCQVVMKIKANQNRRNVLNE